jgi:hypothetical protein
MSQLPDVLLDIVFSYAVNIIDFRKYSLWGNVVLKNNINIIMYRMGVDVNISKLLEYGIIRGSFALAAIQPTFVPSDIDFYFTKSSYARNKISELMISMHYVYQYADRLDYHGFKRFVWEKNGKTIDVIEVEHSISHKRKSLIQYLSRYNDLKCCGYSISMSGSSINVAHDDIKSKDILLRNILADKTNLNTNLLRIEKYSKRGFLTPDPVIISIIKSLVDLKNRNLF